MPGRREELAMLGGKGGSRVVSKRRVYDFEKSRFKSGKIVISCRLYIQIESGKGYNVIYERERTCLTRTFGSEVAVLIKLPTMEILYASQGACRGPIGRLELRTIYK